MKNSDVFRGFNGFNGFEELSIIPWYVWVLIFTLLFTQSVVVFIDAQKRGENKWFWGLLCLVQFPSYGILYWFVSRKVWRRFKKSGGK